MEDQKSPYVNLIVVREANKTEQKVKELVQAYQSAEVEQAAKKEFKGSHQRLVNAPIALAM